MMYTLLILSIIFIFSPRVYAEESATLSKYGQELVYGVEDTRGSVDIFFKEKQTDTDPLFGTDYSQEIKEGRPWFIVFDLDTVDHSSFWEVKRNYNLHNNYDSIELSHRNRNGKENPNSNLITIGIAESSDWEWKFTMIGAIKILNKFQSKYKFKTIFLQYRDRKYHDIWIRSNKVLEKDILLETKIPDEKQGLIISYNSYYFDIDDLTIQEKIILLIHEIFMGMKGYLQNSNQSKLDLICNTNKEYSEDVGYFPGKARVFKSCQLDKLREKLKLLVK